MKEAGPGDGQHGALLLLLLLLFFLLLFLSLLLFMMMILAQWSVFLDEAGPGGGQHRAARPPAAHVASPARRGGDGNPAGAQVH